MAALLLSACAPAPDPEPAPGPLLPVVGSSQDRIDRLQLRGGGNKLLVSLARERGEWRVAERAGWPADGARVVGYLAKLAQARRVEAKTASAAMHARLGVEDIADPEAKGHELSLIGPGVSQRLSIGELHVRSGGRYVRANGAPRAWLTDVDVGFDPDPVDWLDRRLVSIPLARVERVRIRPRGSAAFALVHRDDRFRPDDAPPGAMRDSHAGDQIASVLEAFDVDDVGTDDGSRTPSQELDYELVDGTVLTISIWRDGQRDWARLSADFDEARASAWATQARRPQALAEARAKAQAWTRRFEGRRFLLPRSTARTLTLDHSQILEGVPEMTP
jgi:hypothetical protein